MGNTCYLVESTDRTGANRAVCFRYPAFVDCKARYTTGRAGEVHGQSATLEGGAPVTPAGRYLALVLRHTVLSNRVHVIGLSVHLRC